MAMGMKSFRRMQELCNGDQGDCLMATFISNFIQATGFLVYKVPFPGSCYRDTIPTHGTDPAAICLYGSPPHRPGYSATKPTSGLAFADLPPRPRRE